MVVVVLGAVACCCEYTTAGFDVAVCAGAVTTVVVSAVGSASFSEALNVISSGPESLGAVAESACAWDAAVWANY